MLARLRYDFRSSLGQAHENAESFVQRCTAWMQERLADDRFWRCWLAEGSNAPMGNLWAQIIEKIPNPVSESEHHAYITNFYVRDDWRGHGIGSMLLSAALTWIQTNEVHAVFLWPTERSRQFYLRHGFSLRGDIMEMIIGSGND